jgi:hypothetical protein
VAPGPASRGEHRPWPLPERPWSWRQRCRDVLFLHWPVAPAGLRALVPDALDIDETAGSGWISVVALRLSGVAARRWPAIPGVSRFPQLNVRTYVRHAGRPGVWFFSVDAGNRIAAWVARRLFHLPYHHAAMAVRRVAGRLEYRSVRAPGPAFEAVYAPAGPAAPAAPGSVEHWLTERYCLYSAAPSGPLYRAEIHHGPWPLQPADAAVRRNELLHALGIAVARPAPLRRFSAGVDIVTWSLERVG